MAETEIIKVTKAAQAAGAAQAAAEVLRGGGLVGFPTETVYGIAAAATSADAMARLRKIKSRPKRPFTVHLGSPDDVGRYVRTIPGAARRLIERAWPGPVTLLLPTGGELAEEKLDTPQMRRTLCSGDLIGLRCPDEPTARAMLSAVDAPVVAPSANLEGEPSPRSAQDVLRGLNGQIDLLLDTGPARVGTDSTIVKFEGPRWSVARPGAVDDTQLRELMGCQVIYVCTGNTCRSPMAEGLARMILAERLGCQADALAEHGLEVLSAGVFAASGGHATDEARQAALDMGVDISNHRSRKLTSKLIKSADMIFCMTQSHVAQVVGKAPAAATKTFRVDPSSDISDPIGASVGVYRKTADRLRRALAKVLEEKVL